METLLACLTTPGKAAIATLAVRGPLAWPITRELFKPHKGTLPEEPTAGRFWYGKLGQAHADDAILAVKADTLELHCHGGIEIVRMLQDIYRERGVVIVPWQQFSTDPSIKILDLLAHAPTTRTAAILLDQANGAWERCVQQIEANGNPELVMPKVARLQALIPLGTHLVEPWKIVIGGAPNVGKSSLMNALAGYCRSVVSPVPGTTRDVVTTRIAIDGWPVGLTDTAGMRATSSPLEQQGIARAEAAAEEADLRFWLVDGSATPVFPDDRSKWSVIINKIDLPAAWDWRLAEPAQRISAQTHAGLAELCAMISWCLVPGPPSPGEAVPCLPEHLEWLQRAKKPRAGEA
jgi:tRNA modification GTPase